MRDDDANSGRVLARREVSVLFGTGAGAAVLAASVPKALSRVPWLTPYATRGVAVAGTLPSCVVRPEQTQGPYLVDEKLLRSDIRPDPSDGSVRPGTSLTLAFVVSRIDGPVCSPFEGVLVDVGHCDALGVYSDVVDPGFDTTAKKFLRGVVPAATSAADAKSRRTARRFKRRMNKLTRLLERAASSSGSAQRGKYAKARARLESLLAASRQADEAGTLGTALAPIEDAIAALTALLPA